MNPEIEINPEKLAAQKAAEEKASLDILLTLGTKKQKDFNISLTPHEDQTNFSWGLMNEFLGCFDRGNTDTNSLRWAFLSMIGTLKGRDCWVNFAGRPLYPNMYTALVGDPGCGKSTAITVVRDLMDELGYPSKSPEIVEPGKLAYYFSTEYKQGRVDTLPIGESGSVVNSSAQRNFLASFNADGKSPGMALDIRERHSGQQLITKGRLDELDHDALGIISSELMGTIPPSAKWFINKILIDLYDAHDYERYEPTEGVILTKPIISLLGGITASGLAKTFDTSDFNTGLLTRIMLVHSKDVEKGNPFEQVHDYKASTILLEQLNKVYDFKGEITISEEAKKTYKIIAMMQHNTSYDIRLTFYYNRRTLFLTKIGMILALLHGRSEITRPDLVTANTLLLYTEFDMPKALTEFGNTATIRIRNAIIDYLEKQLNREQGVTSKDIIENVAAKLGLSRETAITLEIQNLVQTRLITALELDSVMQYHLSKPKNTDIIEAKKVKVADDAAIPEWNISEYNMEEDTGPDWGDIKL